MSLKYKNYRERKRLKYTYRKRLRHYSLRTFKPEIERKKQIRTIKRRSVKQTIRRQFKPSPMMRRVKFKMPKLSKMPMVSELLRPRVVITQRTDTEIHDAVKSKLKGKQKRKSTPWVERKHLIFSLKLTDLGKTVMKGATIHERAKVSNMIRRLYNDVELQGNRIIKIVVPEETGDLRESLIDSISAEKNIVPSYQNDRLEDMKCEMKIFTKISYAKYVNAMEFPYIVAHNKERISRRTGQPLYDPYAEYHFFSVVMRRMKMTALRVNLWRFRRTINKYVKPFAFEEIFEIKGLKMR